MLLEEENAAVVKADALEDTITVKETVIEHGNLGIRFIHKLAVEVDFQVLHERE